MGWRDVIGPWDDGPNVFGALLDMPAADRIALARELLAGTSYEGALDDETPVEGELTDVIGAIEPWPSPLLAMVKGRKP